MDEKTGSRLAVLETQYIHLLRSQESHAQDNKERFNKLDMKLDALFEVMNKGKGAYAFALVAAGAIGGGIAKIIAFFATRTS